MITAGIIGRNGKTQTANLISSFLTLAGKKVSIIDSKNITELDFKQIRSYLCELERNDTDILVFKINILDVRRYIYDDLHFDIIVYTDKADDFNEISINDYIEHMRRFFSLVDEKGIVIVNVDDTDFARFSEGMKCYVVTYGFNTKASITTSSVGDVVFKESFICCLQRTIFTKDGKVIEPQEYRIDIEPNEFNTHNVLAAVTFAVVNGIDLGSLERIGVKN